jgi:PAS domain S-box-containing protein
MEEKNTLRQADTRFFDNEAMFLYDHYTFDIIDANSIALQKYGYSLEELQSMKISDLGEKYDSGIEKDLVATSIWKHFNKKGDHFYIQFTLHQIKFRERIAKVAIAHDISDQIDTLQSNLHQLPRVDTMRAQLPMATIEWDPDANVRDWSEAATRIFGWRFDEIIGKNLFEVGMLPESIIKKAQENINNFTTHEHTTFSITSEHLTKDGRQIFCTWHNAAIYDQSGKLLSIYSLVEDITEKKKAEEQLRESEQRFRVLSDASLVGVYMLQDRQFKYVNPRLCEMSGYSQRELLDNFDPLQMIHHEDRKKVSKLRGLWHKKEIDSFEIDLRAYTHKNNLIHVKVYGSKIDLGDKPALIGVIVDQTKQVEAAEKYMSSVESYRALFDSIGDSIYIVNQKGLFIEVNKTVLETFGFSRNEIIGKSPEYLSAPGKVKMTDIRNRFRLALNGEPQRFQWWAKKKNGDIFPNDIHLNPGMYFGEKAVIAISHDMTEQFEQQNELKQNEELFRQLFLNAPVGIALLDEHKEIMMVNHGFEEIFGYSLKEIKGLEIDSVIAPEDKLAEAKHLSASNEPFEVSSVRRRNDGKLIDVLIYGVPVIVEGKTIAIYGIYVDITDRKEAERQVLQSLKEKEVLLSEIHHRVKNNLAVITGLLELQSHNTENETARKALKDSQMRINSMALIHEKLYQNETLSRIDFDHYIRELTEAIRKSHLNELSDVELKFETENIQFTITQAIPCGLLLNEIVTNAFKHAFAGDFSETPKIKIVLNKSSGDEILLKIEDNGCGLPDKFEALGKESLGLTLVRTLSKQINAEMTVISESGTKYIFTFDMEPLKTPVSSFTSENAVKERD